MVSQVLGVILGLMDVLGLLDQQALKACRAPQGKSVHKVYKVYKVYKESLVQRGLKDSKE